MGVTGTEHYEHSHYQKSIGCCYFCYRKQCLNFLRKRIKAY